MFSGFPSVIACPREDEMFVVSRFVRRRVLAGLAIACVAAVCPAARSDDVIETLLDRATMLDMPPGAQTIVIGNPGIADVTVLRRQNRLVLTAKAFGETNVIALDAHGAALTEFIVRVKGVERLLIVQRGMERESYACTPRCEPVTTLGDAPRHMNETIGQSTSRNMFASPPASKP